PNLLVWGSTSTLPDGQRFAMQGTIENFGAAVQDSTGACRASLKAMGVKNPFAGASDGAVQLWRVAGMHFAGDQVIVLQYPTGTQGLSQNGMDGLRVLHPGGLIQKTPSDVWSSMVIRPHGTPNGNTIELHPVRGGGGACQPGS